MVIIGLCGSSGAGKGYVSKAFEKYGVPSIDTDRLYRETTVKKGTECLNELVKAFGSEILTEDGELNRTKLASIVFEGDGSRERLSRLNEITHRYIKIDTEALLAKYAAEGKRAAIIDAPVLFESGFDKMCDITVSVIAPQDVKIDRIVSRDGISKEKAKSRLNSQLSNEELIALTTYTVDNSNCDIDSQIEQILKNEKII